MEIVERLTRLEATMNVWMKLTSGALALMVPLIAGFLVYVAKLNTVVSLTTKTAIENREAIAQHSAKVYDLERQLSMCEGLLKREDGK